MRKALLFFGILDDLDIEWLISVGRPVLVDAGTVLIREGQPVGDLYLVLGGELSVTIAAAGNREIARAMAGELLGEISFVDSRPPSASVTAVKQSSLFAIPRGALARKLEEDVEFAAHFYRATSVFLADRLRATDVRMGFGSGAPTEAQIDERDELDGRMLEGLSLAGARFDTMLRRAAGM
jgi:CRP-like cAMP-binding protein